MKNMLQKLSIFLCMLTGLLSWSVHSVANDDTPYGYAFAIPTQAGGIFLQARMPVTDKRLREMLTARELVDAIRWPEPLPETMKPASQVVFVERHFDTLEEANTWIGNQAEEAADTTGYVGRWANVPQAAFTDFTGFSVRYVDENSSSVIFSCTNSEARTNDVERLLQDGYTTDNGLHLSVRQTRENGTVSASVFFIQEVQRDQAPSAKWLHALSSHTYGLDWLTELVEGM